MRIYILLLHHRHYGSSPVHLTNAESAFVCREEENHTNHCIYHDYSQYPARKLKFILPWRVESCVRLDGWLHTKMVYPPT